MFTDSSPFGSEWRYVFSTPLCRESALLDFRAVDFLDFTFRLRLCRSVENLLLTSSLALLDSTLPKIRQNDGKGIRHTEALAEVSFNIDPETSGFCVVRSDSADTKEQKVRRTTTKCSEQRLFVKQNPRQFRVTGNCLSFRTRFGICLFAEFTKYCRNRFFGLFKTSEWRRKITVIQRL